ncbi:MAG: hypothetical protein ACK4M1_05720 [Flavobacterium sp.]
MKKIFFLIISLMLLSCKPTLKTIYQSKCFILGEAEYVLKINNNGEFQFKSHLSDTINGNWTLSKDTLTLNSEYFIEASSFDIEKDSIIKNTKYTEFDKQEKYLIKRRKLFLITKKGISKECYLK